MTSMCFFLLHLHCELHCALGAWELFCKVWEPFSTVGVCFAGISTTWRSFALVLRKNEGMQLA